MTALNEGLDQILVGPTEQELNDVLGRAVKAANARCRTARVELGAAECAQFCATVAKQPEGWRQWVGGPAGPKDRDHRSALAVAWWADPLGRRHVRVRGARWSFNYDRHALTNVFCPFDEKRPPLWMIYPDFIYAGQRGRKWHTLAACPCGVAGKPEAIGWVGDRCAACHDRREEGLGDPGAAARRLVTPITLSVNDVGSVAFSDDGRELAAATLSPQVLAVWDLATGEVQRLQRGFGVSHHVSLCFLPGRHTLAFPDRGNVELVDTGTWQRRTGVGAGQTVKYLAVSPDGRLLLTVHYREGPVVWDLRTGRQRWAAGAEGGPAPICAEFTPDGQRVVVGCALNVLRRWDTASGKELERWGASGDDYRGVQSLALSPDGRFLASLLDSTTKNLLVREAATGTVRATLTLKRERYHPVSGLRLLAVAPDGRTLAGSELGGVLRFWDLESGRELGALSSAPHREVLCLAFAPDGRWLAEGGHWGHVKLWPWRALLDALGSL
jgi:WD40 repeat protein